MLCSRRVHEHSIEFNLLGTTLEAHCSKSCTVEHTLSGNTLSVKLNGVLWKMTDMLAHGLSVQHLYLNIVLAILMVCSIWQTEGNLTSSSLRHIAKIAYGRLKMQSTWRQQGHCLVTMRACQTQTVMVSGHTMRTSESVGEVRLAAWTAAFCSTAARRLILLQAQPDEHLTAQKPVHDPPSHSFLHFACCHDEIELHTPDGAVVGARTG